MSIDPKFLNFFIKATEMGAIGASKFIGKQDKIAADKGAVDPMRKQLNTINMEGTVVIGEGEMDEGRGGVWARAAACEGGVEGAETESCHLEMMTENDE